MKFLFTSLICIFFSILSAQKVPLELSSYDLIRDSSGKFLRLSIYFILNEPLDIDLEAWLLKGQKNDKLYVFRYEESCRVFIHNHEGDSVNPQFICLTRSMPVHRKEKFHFPLRVKVSTVPLQTLNVLGWEDSGFDTSRVVAFSYFVFDPKNRLLRYEKVYVE